MAALAEANKLLVIPAFQTDGIKRAPEAAFGGKEVNIVGPAHPPLASVASNINIYSSNASQSRCVRAGSYKHVAHAVYQESTLERGCYARIMLATICNWFELPVPCDAVSTTHFDKSSAADRKTPKHDATVLRPAGGSEDVAG